MRKTLVALTASVSMSAVGGIAHADTFQNGSFETGTLQGWTSGGGFWSGGPYPVPSDYLAGGSAFDASVQNNSVTSAGNDPRTDNLLRQVYAGNHSAQINNPINDYSVSVLTQRVNGYTDPIIAFAYAAVLQDSHGPTDSDAFIITLTDATTNKTLFSFNLNSATAPGTFTRSSQGWYYTDWLTQSIDVSTLQGHDFVLSLLANDCPYGGHAGYAYLDGFGSVVGGGGTGGGGTVNQNQYWDGDAAGNANNNVVDGGNGVWDATAAHFTLPTGATNNAYSNPGTVIFSGAPGTVTVDNSKGQIGINGMNFVVDGYHIVGDPIDLAGTVATVAVGDGTANGASFVATVDAPLKGSGGLTKTDLGTLVLGGVNTYTGTTTVTSGTLIGSATSFGTGGVNDNANFVIAQPTDATFANMISGTGNFYKTGAGTLNLTGNSPFAGATSVEQGRLRVDGNLGSSVVTVKNGASLGGYGTVGGVVAQAGSTIAPGGSIGTLTVNGNYKQAAGSTYAAEVTSTGQNDRLNISGTTTLDPGSKIVVTKLDAPRYVLGQRYTVLAANGGVTGKYLLSGDTHVSLFYNLVDHYDATHVYLDVAQTRSFASAGATPNQIAAGGGADTVTGSLHDAIGYLQTESQARAAFDSISGEIYATERAAAFEDSRFIREAVNDRLRNKVDGQALWFHGFGSWGHMNGDGNAARYDRNIAGFFLGLDMIRSGSLKIGALVGYDNAKLKLPARASSATADDAHVGFYAGIGGPKLAARLGATYTFRSLNTNRSVAFPGFSDQLSSKYTLGIGQVFGEVGYRIPLGKKASIEPVAGLAYVHLDSGHVIESGGAARLDMPSQDSHILFSTLGARVSAGLGSGDGPAVRLNASAAWRHASRDRDVLATLAFVGGDSFSIAAPPIAKDVAALDAGAEMTVGPRGALLAVSYSGQIGKGLADHGVKASLTFPF